METTLPDRPRDDQGRAFRPNRLDRFRAGTGVLLARLRDAFGRKRLADSRLVDVRPLADQRLWCRFNDGLEGVVDFSHLAEIAWWRRECESRPGGIDAVFDAVVIDHRALCWAGDMDACGDWVRLRVLGLPDDAGPEAVAVPEYPDLVHAKALEPFSLWCAFGDGTRGVADFSEWAANPRFERWRTEEGFFASVKARRWCLDWGDWVRISKECVYERIVGPRRGRPD